MSHIYLESHGVQLDVEVEDQELVRLVEAILPPGWRRSEQFPEDGHLALGSAGNGTYEVVVDGSLVATDVTADVAIHVLDAQLRARIALLARDRIFIHAGVVAVGQRAIVIPAPSFAGKSSLVAALVSAGATYYSDEFAVLDDTGCVHAYSKPLSLRADDARFGEITPAAALGAAVGTTPVEVGVIAIARYVPGSRWDPMQLESGAGALGLLSNAVPARSRPEATMRAISRAAVGATVLEGDRGEAAETAVLLLHSLSG
jgi:hypothetical protein